MVSFDDKFNQDDKGNAEKKKALYKWDHQEGLDTEVGKTLLGKRANGQRDATQFEHIRDYAMSLKKNSAQDEYVLHVDPNSNLAQYAPLAAKVALLKKKGQSLQKLKQNDYMRETNAGLIRDQELITPNFLVIAPRGAVKSEMTRMD